MVKKPDDLPTLEELLKRIEDLEKRLRSLERERAQKKRLARLGLKDQRNK